MPPTPLRPEQAASLRDAFAAAGYHREAILERAGSLVPPPPRSPLAARLLDETAVPSPLHHLLRWFVLGEPVEAARAEAELAPPTIDLLARCRLIHRDGESWLPAALVTPHERFLVATDRHQHRDTTAGAADHVLAVNDPALSLARLAVRSRAADTLDLCSGAAIHALVAADFSDRVVASDLSPRAAGYARFNAWLNSVTNLDAVTGSKLDPVAGRAFDRILCNPPFFVSPDLGQSYRASGLELDEFCRSLISEVPRHLRDGGICQLICEWVELDDGGWQDRLAGWFAASGCDVWVLVANMQHGETYARERSRATDAVGDADAAATCDRWLRYLSDRRVTKVLGGFVVLHKRNGNNWIRFEQLRQAFDRPIGAAIEHGIAARSLLAAGDAALLASRPRIAPGLRLERQHRWTGAGWQDESTVLRVVDGLPAAVGIDEAIRGLVESCDGSRTVAEALAMVAARAGVEPAAVETRGLRLVEMLLLEGCLVAG